MAPENKVGTSHKLGGLVKPLRVEERKRQIKVGKKKKKKSKSDENSDFQALVSRQVVGRSLDGVIKPESMTKFQSTNLQMKNPKNN